MSHVLNEKQKRLEEKRKLQEYKQSLCEENGVTLKQLNRMKRQCQGRWCDNQIPLWQDFCDECEEDQRQEARAYDDDLIDGVGFADPYGRSALRAEVGGSSGHCPHCSGHVGQRDVYCKHCGSQLNPRCFPCPSCKRKNALTFMDVQAHYQCDWCADRMECPEQMIYEGRLSVAEY